MLWSKEKRKKISKQNPNLHNSEISKMLGELRIVETSSWGDEKVSPKIFLHNTHISVPIVNFSEYISEAKQMRESHEYLFSG